MSSADVIFLLVVLLLCSTIVLVGFWRIEQVARLHWQAECAKKDAELERASKAYREIVEVAEKWRMK